MSSNLAEDRFVLSVTGGASATTWTGPTSFVNPLRAQISDLWITRVVVTGNATYTASTTAIGPIDWQANAATIQINAIPGLTNGVSYDLTLRMAI